MGTGLCPSRCRRPRGRAPASAAVDVGVEIERRAVDSCSTKTRFERVIESCSRHRGSRPHCATRSKRRPQAGDRRSSSRAARSMRSSMACSRRKRCGGWIDGVIDNLSRRATPLSRRMPSTRSPGSPAVTAAITQQGLGFADQVGDAVRVRSRERRRYPRSRRTAPDDAPGQSSARRLAINRSFPPTSRPLPRREPPAASTSTLAAIPEVRDCAGRCSLHRARHAGDRLRDRRGAGSPSWRRSSASGLALIVGVLDVPGETHKAIGGHQARAFLPPMVRWIFRQIWSVTKPDTAGARAMGFRVIEARGGRLVPRRAFVRLVGLVLAAIPLFAGYLVPSRSTQNGGRSRTTWRGQS